MSHNSNVAIVSTTDGRWDSIPIRLNTSAVKSRPAPGRQVPDRRSFRKSNGLLTGVALSTDPPEIPPERLHASKSRAAHCPAEFRHRRTSRRSRRISKDAAFVEQKVQ